MLSSLVRLGTILALSLPAATQSERLNPPFELPDVVGDVRDFRVHPAGGEVLFRADVRREGSLELHRAPLDGSRAPLPVVALGVGRAVHRYELDAGGRWLVFTADRDVRGEVGLHVHEVGVPGARRLGAAAHGDVGRFELAPDGLRVLYLARPDDGVALADSPAQLYGVLLDGSAPAVRFNADLAPDTYVVSFAARAARVAFALADGVTGRVDLYGAVLDGSAPAVLLDPGISHSLFSDLPEYELSADGARVVYRAARGAGPELFSVPSDASAGPVRLNAPVPVGGLVPSFRLAPDGARVVFSATNAATGLLELYAAPLDGSAAPTSLSGAGTGMQSVQLLAVNGPRAFYTRAGFAGGFFGVPIDGSAAPLKLDDRKSVGSVRFTGDGARAVYLIGNPSSPTFTPVGLRSVPVDGSAPFAPLAASFVSGFEISPDGTRVLYGSNEGDVESVPIDASGPAVRIASNSTGVTDSRLRFGFTPDGQGALAVVDSERLGRFELFAAHAATGQGRRKLSGALALGTFADVGRLADSGDTHPRAFVLDPAGARAAFTADANQDERFELFSAATDGSGGALPLSGLGVASETQLTPDGQRAVYKFHPTSDWAGDLYVTPLDGSASPLRINAPLADGQVIGSFRVSAGGARVVYVVTSSTAPYELWSAPLLGHGSPVLLAQGASWSFMLSPDGTRVVTSAGGQVTSLAIDGSAAAVPLGPGGNLFAISPDSSRVLYTRDSGALDELSSAPLDGSAGPAVLATGLALSPELSPDGQWVVFTSTPAFQGSFELYRAPLDGSAPALKLSQALVAGGSVLAFAIGSDSAQVVYVADAETDGVGEVYGVPLDGSAAPVRLSGPMVPGGGAAVDTYFGFGALPFAFTPDAAHVLYLADQDTDDVFELYAAASDGSAAPVKLSGAMVAGGDVNFSLGLDRPFAVTADSTRVVYCADQDVDGVNELYLVPLDRSSRPLRLNGPLAESGCLSVFELAGERLLYQATERPGVTELFSLSLPAIPQQRHLRPR